MRGYENSKIPRLFEMLELRNLKAKDLAVATGISSGSITDWKSGKSTPTGERLAAIANFLNVSADYLLGIDNTPNAMEKVTEDLSAKAERYKESMQIIHNKDGTISVYVSGSMIPELVKNKGPESQKIISSILNDLADMEEDELKRAKKVIEALK